MSISDDLCLKTNGKSYLSQACHIVLLFVKSALHCHSHLQSNKCCAGNPLWQETACYKWADTERDTATDKKKVPSHLTRMTPLRLLSISLWRTQAMHMQSMQNMSPEHDGQLLNVLVRETWMPKRAGRTLKHYHHTHLSIMNTDVPMN